MCTYDETEGETTTDTPDITINGPVKITGGSIIIETQHECLELHTVGDEVIVDELEWDHESGGGWSPSHFHTELRCRRSALRAHREEAQDEI